MSEREYNSQYNLSRYHKRRNAMLEILGGSCLICGVTENLHVDHIDPNSKSFEISKNWSKPWKLILEELTKCQLLCITHHVEKTLTYGDNDRLAAKHGSISMYRHHKCRCADCVKANTIYQRKFY